MYSSCPVHFTVLEQIILFILGDEYKLWLLPFCTFLQLFVFSFLVGPNILICAMFSYTLSLCFSLNVRDQVSRPYITVGKIVVLCILIKFLDSRRAFKNVNYS
jgi:hypothetical protein